MSRAKGSGTFMDSSALTDIASKSRLSEDDRDMAELLNAACNDWPAPNLKDACDLASMLEKEISKTLTLAHLTDYVSTLTLAHDAWKAEATTSVIAFLQRSIEHGLSDDTALGEAIEHFGKRCGDG